MPAIQSAMSRNIEPESIKEFVDSEHPTILEVGCNDGTDTNKFLGALPTARIYCFEPDPRAITRYRKTVHNERATLTEVAVSNKDGMASFHGSSGQPPNRGPNSSHYCLLDEWDLSGSLCKPTGHLAYSPWVTFPEDRQYEVRTIRLDTWIQQHPEIQVIDFIWCDVQGAEALVIEGAQHTLGRTRYFYVEFYDYAPRFKTPLYEGQLPLAKLQEMIPQFELQGIHGDCALLKNRGLK